MLNRRSFLTAGLTLVGLAGAGAALVATRRFDDVARMLGIDAPRYQDEADFALLDAVAEDEGAFVAELRAVAEEHDDDEVATALVLAEEQAAAVRAEVPSSAQPLSAEELRGRLDALVAARRADVERAGAPEFAGLLASLAAGHAQQRRLLEEAGLS